MNWLAGLAYVGFALSSLFGWLVALIYVSWAFNRSVRRNRLLEQSDDVGVRARLRPLTGDADVTFEARWGMVLALPALEIAVLMIATLPTSPWSCLALVVVLSHYAVTMLADLDVKLPRWVWWWPGTAAAVYLLLLAIWIFRVPSDESWIALMLGGGYVATAVMAGGRLARSVARRDAARATHSRQLSVVDAEHGFVWPH